MSQEVLNQYHSDSVKISLVLFDEIEKANDALWELLLGIMDKATLTLGDNRRVDFSKAMIFMTSNLGAKEMGAVLNPKMGFHVPLPIGEINKKIISAGIAAARRRFTPEFINRLDKMTVFNPLGEAELREILDIELMFIQNRIFGCGGTSSFIFTVNEAAKQFLMEGGVDIKHGARHIKRSIELILVRPLSNLIATQQVLGGDLLVVDYDSENKCLTFVRKERGLSLRIMKELVSQQRGGKTFNPIPVSDAGAVFLKSNPSRRR